MPDFAVYILASYRHGTLYTGMTRNLARRIHEHKTGANTRSFSHQYRTHYLVYYEYLSGFIEARDREKALKGTNRKRKIWLIEGMNPEWRDLAEELV